MFPRMAEERVRRCQVRELIGENLLNRVFKSHLMHFNQLIRILRERIFDELASYVEVILGLQGIGIPP